MMNKEFMQESMDLKRLVLCLRKKMGMILLITVCGALLCSGIYLMMRETVMKTQWQAKSQFYMQFIYDPSGQVEQSYNGYTWNDLLHGDPVIDRIMEVLVKEEEGIRAIVRESIKGEILSDVRLLTVTITTDHPEWTSIIQEAMETGLLGYAQEQKEIISMELIRSTQPEKVIWDNHTTRAAVGGGILFLIIALFVWLFYYILDDSIYVIADGEKRYPFPLLGLLVKDRNGEKKQPYAGQLAENVSYLLGDMHKLTFLSVDNVPFMEQKTDRADRWAKDIFDSIMKEKVTGKNWETVVLEAAGQGSGIGAKLRDTDGVILVVPFGQRNGKKIDQTISFLQNQDAKIQGILITEGDEKFWKSYYGSKKEKAE